MRVGKANNKNLTVPIGNCNRRHYYDVVIEYVRSDRLDPTKILTQAEPMTGAIEAHQTSDERQPEWIKVELEPAS